MPLGPFVNSHCNALGSRGGAGTRTVSGTQPFPRSSHRTVEVGLSNDSNVGACSNSFVTCCADFGDVVPQPARENLTIATLVRRTFDDLAAEELWRGWPAVCRSMDRRN